MRSDEQRDQLTQIVQEENLHLSDVWLRYSTHGGRANEDQFARYAAGEYELAQLQRDLISIALRELVAERQESQGIIDTRNRPGCRRPGTD
ncbi:hypothetical protein ACX80U_12825 [Arthrobacter sp. TmT3-37]